MSQYETEVLESIQRKLARIEVNQKLFEGRLETGLKLIYERERLIMAALTDLQAKAAAQSTALDTLATAIAGIPKGGLTPADQATVDATFAELTTNDGKIAAAQAAVASLTPPPPAPPAPPVTPPPA